MTEPGETGSADPRPPAPRAFLFARAAVRTAAELDDGSPAPGSLPDGSRDLILRAPWAPPAASASDSAAPLAARAQESGGRENGHRCGGFTTVSWGARGVGPTFKRKAPTDPKATTDLNARSSPQTRSAPLPGQRRAEDTRDGREGYRRPSRRKIRLRRRTVVDDHPPSEAILPRRCTGWSWRAGGPRQPQPPAATGATTRSARDGSLRIRIGCRVNYRVAPQREPDVSISRSVSCPPGSFGTGVHWLW